MLPGTKRRIDVKIKWYLYRSSQVTRANLTIRLRIAAVGELNAG